MSEPTTLYILITPVLKANKVLGRIETFRLAQPLVGKFREIGAPRTNVETRRLRTATLPARGQPSASQTSSQKAYPSI